MISFSNRQYAGYLPEFFSELDVRTAEEQLDEAYQHGGGVQPFKGFKLCNWEVAGGAYLAYPGDPDMKEISRDKLRDETIILFEAEWVAIVQPDGSHMVTRCD